MTADTASVRLFHAVDRRLVRCLVRRSVRCFVRGNVRCFLSISPLNSGRELISSASPENGGIQTLIDNRSSDLCDGSCRSVRSRGRTGKELKHEQSDPDSPV